ncbi:MAG: hypothetical protein H0X25_20665 [Acidobacteriales bacterium]|nr:hypothetical protein [Terriglobales bacterium]
MSIRKAILYLLASTAACGNISRAAAQNSSLLSRDLSVKPGDDFYRYANGGWLKTAVIPAGRPSYDSRTMLVERTSQRVRDLVQGAAAAHDVAGSLTQKVRDYYASFMDEDSIEARGMTPLDEEMAGITAIADKVALSAFLGASLNSEVEGLTSNADHILGVWINQGFEDSDHNFPHLLQGGLGLPTRDDYIDSSPQAAALRGRYQTHIAAILKLLGIADPEGRAARVMSLEVRIAESHAPESDAADVFKQNNQWKRADFSVKAPGMDWEAYFRSAGLIGQSDFVVWQPSAVTGTAALVGSESIDVWKDYLRFHLVEHYSSVLPKAVAGEDFSFYGATLAGSRERPSRSNQPTAHWAKP